METPGNIFLVSGIGEDTGGGVFAFDGQAVEQIDRISTTGLAVRGGALARLLWSPGQAGSVGEILIYDERGVRRYWRVDDLREGHDLAWHRDDLLAVSTMTNSVLRLAPNGEVSSEWEAPGDGDAWHLNSLLVEGERVYVCAFGRFPSHRAWSGDAAGRGIVLDMTTGADVLDGLSRPHDPRLDGDEWLVCNSGKGELLRIDAANGEITARAQLGGWTRGLAVVGEEIYAGVSGDRAVLRPDDLARIAILRRHDLEVVRWIAMPCREIYDIVEAPLELVQGVRTGFRTNPLRAREQDQHSMFEKAGVRPARLWATGEPLPPDACVVTVDAEVPGSLVQGSLHELECRVTNDGNAILVSAPPNPVNVSYRWVAASGDEEEGLRTPLPNAVSPGESVVCNVAVLAPTRPGAYRLRLTLVQEQVSWFDEIDARNAYDAAIEVR